MVRADKGDNMGYLDGYGECFVMSDAITAGVLPFDGCEDFGFESNYCGLTDTPEGILM